MISITAQNKFFDALNTMVNSGANNSEIDRLYDEMIAEIETNNILLNDEHKNKLLANLKTRFSKFSGIRIARTQFEKFKKDEFILKPCPSIIEVIEQQSKDENNTGDKNYSFDKNKEVSPQSSFKLLDNVLTTDCFTTLLNHNFINKNTQKKDFAQIFKGKEVIIKIDWAGNLQELARFVFLLHNDYEKPDNKAVCEHVKNLKIITSKCFTYKNKEINPYQLNNRNLKDTTRYALLLKAIAHLQNPKNTTRTHSRSK